MCSSLFCKVLFTFLLSALDGKLSVERPLYTENSMSIRKGIKKGRFNGLKKIAGHMRHPFGSASLELWLTAPVPQLCRSPASGGCFGSWFTREERRTICDKTSSSLRVVRLVWLNGWKEPLDSYHARKSKPFSNADDCISLKGDTGFQQLSRKK